MDIKGWGLLISLSLVWGCSFFFVELIIDDMPAHVLVTWRVIIAAIGLWLYAFILHRSDVVQALRQITWPLLGALLIMGIINNAIPFFLLSWGQVGITSGVASILNAMTPFFTLVFAHIFTTDERITFWKSIGIGLAFLGTVVIFFPASGLDPNTGAPDTGTNTNIMQEKIPHMAACLGAAISYGVAMVWGRRIARMGLNPLMMATGQLTASSLFMAALVFIVLQTPVDFANVSSTALMSLVGLALLSTSLAYLIFFRLIVHVGATNTSLVTILVSIAAMILGTLFLDEELTLSALLGFCLVAAGLMAVDGRAVEFAKKRLNKAASA